MFSVYIQMIFPNYLYPSALFSRCTLQHLLFSYDFNIDSLARKHLKSTHQYGTLDVSPKWSAVL